MAKEQDLIQDADEVKVSNSQELGTSFLIKRQLSVEVAVEGWTSISHAEITERWHRKRQDCRAVDICGAKE